MTIRVDNYDETTGVCRLRDEHGRMFSAKCEPTGKRVNENQNSKQKGEDQMQTVNYEQRKQILAYACGRLNALGAAGAAVDLAAREYMERTATEDYSVAIRAVIKEAEIAARKDAREFEFRTRAYMSEWHLDKAEAERRVAAHDPRMAALYDETD